MNEESEIFISVWLPPDLDGGEKIPTLIRTERYADQVLLKRIDQFRARTL